jgi:hypothetical protein
MTRLALLSILFCALSAEERFFPVAIDQDNVAGAPDFSFLNQPLTPAARTIVRDGHFYTVGKDLKPNTADDKPLRFFGVNFAFGASFPEPADSARIAKRLRRLGVNLVRLHHMDTSPDADPANCRSLLTTGPYPTLNPISVERLRRLLDAFKAEGIYVNLNLHVGYEFRPGVDKVPPVAGADRLPTHTKPLHIFYPRMVDLQLEYTRRVIDALKLRDDPVLGMVEIDNEASLLWSWQVNQLDKLATGEYQAELARQKQAFLKGRPDSTDETIRFLIDRDRAYLNRMRDAVRAAAGPLAPITGTQVGFGGLLTYDSHDGLDYIDNHFYIDHFNFPNQRWDSRDWRIRDTSGAGSGYSQYLNMAATRQLGRPYTVSEFNQPFPTTYAAEHDPTLAIIAAFQDWDGLMHFAYEHGRSWDINAPSGFNLNGDWQKWVGAGQAAWLFRTGAVKTAAQAVNVTVPLELRMEATRRKINGNAIKFLPAVLDYDPATAFVHRVALDTKATAAVKLQPAAKPYRADTGEFSYDPDRKLTVLQAPAAAGVFGFAGKERVTAGPIDVQLAPTARGFVALLLTARDGKSIAQSRRLLLTNPGYTLKDDQKLVHYPGTTDWWTLAPPAGPDKPSGIYGGPAKVVRMESVELTLTLRTSSKALRVYPLDGKGARGAALPVEKVAGGFRVTLQAPGQTQAPWFEMEK